MDLGFKLSDLDLKFNNFSNVDSLDFGCFLKTLTSVSKLDLSHTQLNYKHTAVFPPLTNLSHLKLVGNLNLNLINIQLLQLRIEATLVTKF